MSVIENTLMPLNSRHHQHQQEEHVQHTCTSEKDKGVDANDKSDTPQGNDHGAAQNNRTRGDRPSSPSPSPPALPRPLTADIATSTVRVSWHSARKRAVKSIKQVGTYSVGPKLGEGSYGSVHVATHLPTGQEVALKFIDRRKIKEEYVHENLQREVNVMKQLDHPFIIKLLQVLEFDDYLCIVTEKAEKDFLSILLDNGTISEAKAKQHAAELMLAVQHLHDKSIAHRDLKVENMMLGKAKHVKLIDFGLSNQLTPKRHMFTTCCGSLAYSAPELLGQKPYSFSVDVWGIGICLYVMLTARLPFHADSLTQLHANILEKNYTLPDTFSGELKDLLDRCFEFRPNKRITLLEMMGHPWVADDVVAARKEALALTQLDEAIVQQMINMGIEGADTIRESITSNKWASTYVTYQLFKEAKLLRSKRKPCLRTTLSLQEIPRLQRQQGSTTTASKKKSQRQKTLSPAIAKHPHPPAAKDHHTANYHHFHKRAQSPQQSQQGDQQPQQPQQQQQQQRQGRGDVSKRSGDSRAFTFEQEGLQCAMGGNVNPSHTDNVDDADKVDDDDDDGDDEGDSLLMEELPPRCDGHTEQQCESAELCLDAYAQSSQEPLLFADDTTNPEWEARQQRDDDHRQSTGDNDSPHRRQQHHHQQQRRRRWRRSQRKSDRHKARRSDQLEVPGSPSSATSSDTGAAPERVRRRSRSLIDVGAMDIFGDFSLPHIAERPLIHDQTQRTERPKAAVGGHRSHNSSMRRRPRPPSTDHAHHEPAGRLTPTPPTKTSRAGFQRSRSTFGVMAHASLGAKVDTCTRSTKARSKDTKQRQEPADERYMVSLRSLLALLYKAMNATMVEEKQLYMDRVNQRMYKTLRAAPDATLAQAAFGHGWTLSGLSPSANLYALTCLVQDKLNARSTAAGKDGSNRQWRSRSLRTPEPRALGMSRSKSGNDIAQAMGQPSLNPSKAATPETTLPDIHSRHTGRRSAQSPVPFAADASAPATRDASPRMRSSPVPPPIANTHLSSQHHRHARAPSSTLLHPFSPPSHAPVASTASPIPISGASSAATTSPTTRPTSPARPSRDPSGRPRFT